MRASSARVNFFSAKSVGHMLPSSRFALSLKPKRRVSRAELLRAAKEAEDVAVLGVGRHAVPGSWHEVRRGRLHDGVDALAHDAVRFRHLGNLREHVFSPSARRPAALSSLTRSFMAAFSSGVNPLLGWPAAFFAGFWVAAIACTPSRYRSAVNVPIIHHRNSRAARGRLTSACGECPQYTELVSVRVGHHNPRDVRTLPDVRFSCTQSFGAVRPRLPDPAAEGRCATGS